MGKIVELVALVKSVLGFLNGKKTYLGVAITVVAYVASGAGMILPLLGVSAVTVAKVAGVFTIVLGLLHKLYKLAFGEDFLAGK